MRCLTVYCRCLWKPWINALKTSVNWTSSSTWTRWVWNVFIAQRWSPITPRYEYCHLVLVIIWRHSLCSCDRAVELQYQFPASDPIVASNALIQTKLITAKKALIYIKLSKFKIMRYEISIKAKIKSIFFHSPPHMCTCVYYPHPPWFACSHLATCCFLKDVACGSQHL